MLKMEYKVSVKYRNLYKDGRRIKNPKFKKETTCWKRKGMKRGAKGYKQHLIEVYGKNNVKDFSIKKVGKC